MRHLCNRALQFDRQWKHLRLDLSAAPEPVVVAAQMINPIRRPIGRVLNDIELDAGAVAPLPLADEVADMDGPGPDEAGPDSATSRESGPGTGTSSGTSSGSSSSSSSSC